VSTVKQHMLREIGADAVVSYQDKIWEEEVQQIAGGEGVHLVYDGVGMVTSSLKCCRHNGVVVIVGFAGRDNESIESVKVNRILLKSAAVVGYRFGEHGRRDPTAVAKIWSDFDQMMGDGGEAVKAVVYDGVEGGNKYQGVTDVPRAMLDLAEKKVYGRAVVQLASEQEMSRSLKSKAAL
jgi:NADPH:quinone reductase-like Zn-dependent oxidoreductase